MALLSCALLIGMLVTFCVLLKAGMLRKQSWKPIMEELAQDDWVRRNGWIEEVEGILCLWNWLNHDGKEKILERKAFIITEMYPLINQICVLIDHWILLTFSVITNHFWLFRTLFTKPRRNLYSPSTFPQKSHSILRFICKHLIHHYLIGYLEDWFLTGLKSDNEERKSPSKLIAGVLTGAPKEK